MIRICVLGPLQAEVDGAPADLGGPRQRCVLARLIAEHGRVVSADRLIEDLYADGAPPRALSAVHAYVSHLRRALEPARAARAPAEVLVTAPPGYAVRLATDAVDAWSFEDAVHHATGLDDPAEAHNQLSSALERWHGAPFQEYGGLPWADLEASRLDELRLTAVEARAEAAMRLGRAAQSIPELNRLTAEQPLREEAWRLLALALYQSGRQGDALAALRRARARLATDLGVDPGPALRELEDAILAQDPHLSAPPPLSLSPLSLPPHATAPDAALAGPATAVARPATAVARPATAVARPATAVAGPSADPVPYFGGDAELLVTQAPGGRVAAPAPFIGREGELSRLLAALARGVRLVLVVGDAGVGKTRFASEGMARAATAGMLTLRGECLPLAETLPLLPVAAALGELARVDGGGLMRAALDAAPEYVRAEIGRLLPGLGAPGELGPADGRDGGWQRQRLFAAVAELLDAAAGGAGCGVVLVVEDVHWADDATLDLLTFLTRAGNRGVVATCRGDEVPADPRVSDWLARMRGAAGVEEIGLGPLSRDEVAGQAAALAGGTVSLQVVDELYARAEGNPFFTEQLVAATLAGGTSGGLGVPAGLPARLAELLAARAGRCTGEARAVLTGLALAGRPLTEDLLGEVTGLGAEAVRRGLRELAAARLLAEDAGWEACRPRHALLAEAVVGALLPGERAALHGRMARTLAAAGDQALAAEIAGHWEAAGRPADELPARLAAAEAAERVSGYAEAAVHWQRAIELAKAKPGAASANKIGVPDLYLRAMYTLEWSGDSVRAGMLAEEAYRLFASHPDPATAAAIWQRAAYYRAITAATPELSLIQGALALFERAPPSVAHAQAWLDYADIFLRSASGQRDDILPALNRALAIAEAADAKALVPRVLASLAVSAFRHGQIEEGFAFLNRGWNLARAANDARALLWLAVNESDVLLKLARFQGAAEVAIRGLDPAQQAGLGAAWGFTFLAANACEALVAAGRTAEAAALIDPLTAGPPDRDHWLVHVARAEIDLLRGDVDAAADRWRLIDAIPGHRGTDDVAREPVQRAAELAFWTGRPGDAVTEVRRVLPQLMSPELSMLCGRLLAVGIGACAELAEQARERRDRPAADSAASAADDLAAWVGQVAGAPFTDHPFVATIPADRATWAAERTRLTGASDPSAWRAAATAWDTLGCPHRAGYAWWREAEAHLDAGHADAAATNALRAAAAAADGHAPMLARIRVLAERAKIPLQPPAAPPPPPTTNAPALLAGRPGADIARCQ